MLAQSVCSTHFPWHKARQHCSVFALYPETVSGPNRCTLLYAEITLVVEEALYTCQMGTRETASCTPHESLCSNQAQAWTIGVMSGCAT